MKTRAWIAIGVVACAATILAFSAGCAKERKPAKILQKGDQATGKSELRFSEPASHENLSVFLIHGEDRIKDKEFVTLKDALESKQVVINENGNVNQLTIQNNGSVAVYIQSGDIVKGGKQDRMIQYDCVVPPKSDKMPISSFCVEQGRWRPRGKESAVNFNSSSNSAIGNRMKLAAKLEGDQGAVWNYVSEVQENYAGSLGESVQASESASSLELSLSNKKLTEAAKAYEDTLAGIVAGRDDAIGFAVVINGKVSSVDIYASHALFAKLWPKLIKTAAFEAINELKKGAKFDQAGVDDIRSFMAEADKAKADQKHISDDIDMYIRQGKRSTSFKIVSQGEDLHDSYNAND